jgi:hypothetical protein
VPLVAYQTISSQPPLAIANAAQSSANHASIGMVRFANASATTLALHANQLSIGTRKLVLASVLMTVQSAMQINTLIMILARGNV